MLGIREENLTLRNTYLTFTTSYLLWQVQQVKQERKGLTAKIIAKSLLEVYNKQEEESSSTMNTDGEKEQTNMRRQKGKQRIVSFSQSTCSTVHPQPQQLHEKHLSTPCQYVSINVCKADLMKGEYLELYGWKNPSIQTYPGNLKDKQLHN